VPLTWDEEVVLLRRELERAQAALKLEEHNNRKLLARSSRFGDAAAFDQLKLARLDKFLSFLVKQEIIPDKPYLEAALIPQLGHFVSKSSGCSLRA